MLNQPFRAFATHHKLATGELGNFDPVENVRIGVGNRGGYCREGGNILSCLEG